MPSQMPANKRLIWATVGWSAGFMGSVAASVVAVAVVSVGDEAATGTEILVDLSMVGLVLLQVPLWLGLLGTPLLARRRGLDWSEQLGWRMRPVDVPAGLAVGVLMQVAAVPLLYWPIFRVFGDLDVEGPARELADLAGTPLEAALLVAMTVVAAPVTEEVFYRGLLQGALSDRISPRWAWPIASVAFALSHIQWVQMPALLLVGAVHGLLVQRTGRLGPALWSHAGFNAVTVVVLLT